MTEPKQRVTFSPGLLLEAPRWMGYLIAVVTPLAALALRLHSGDLLVGFPFLTFFVAVASATFIGGSGPGLLSIALSSALALLFLPDLQAGFRSARSPQAAITAFIVASGVIVFLFSRMHEAIERAALAESELKRLNADLDRRVMQGKGALFDAEAQRNTVESQLRHVQKVQSIGQLTGGIAHDFNNMLAVVMGSLDMARRRLEVGEADRAAKAIDHASGAVKRAAALTKQLLAFARQQPLEPEVLDANRLVSSTSELLRRTLGETVLIETVLAGGLWKTFADSGQLESAIVNLAVNSRDAMPSGGRLTIETANAELDDRYVEANPDAPAVGQYVQISVTDTGSGMPPSVIEQAVDPFFTTKPIGQGTGLGLSQVFGYVKQSGGHFKIYSEVDRGTCVKIYLPRFLGEQMPRPDAPNETPDVPRGRSEQLILVVEDDGQVRSMAVDMLRELGYSVIHAKDATDAMDHLDRMGEIALLFTDVVMPHMTGRELVERAKVSRPGLRVLYSTGYSRNAVVHNGVLDAGVNLLQKPYTFEALAKKVHAVLNS